MRFLRLNVYMSHIENLYRRREGKKNNLWTHDRDNQMLGQSGSLPLQLQLEPQGRLYVFPLTAPAFVNLILLVPLFIVV